MIVKAIEFLLKMQIPKFTSSEVQEYIAPFTDPHIWHSQLVSGRYVYIDNQLYEKTTEGFRIIRTQSLKEMIEKIRKDRVDAQIHNGISTS